jgi:hypothetical protein
MLLHNHKLQQEQSTQEVGVGVEDKLHQLHQVLAVQE